MGAPRDFLEGTMNSKSQSYWPRDFLEINEPQETIGEAIKYAPFRIGEDLLNAGYQGLQNLPKYYEKGKTEIPAFFNPLNGIQHPITRTKNAAAGLAELGHGLINTPYNVTNYLENRLNLLPKGAADKIKSLLYQKDISNSLNQFTGGEENPGDILTRGILRNATNIIPAAKVANILNPLNLTAKNITKDILKTRENNINAYGQRYGNIWKEAEGKGFNDALYNVDLDMQALKKFSPQKGIQGILDFDAKPTLENAHAAKSDLLRIKRDLDKLTTLRTSERKQLKAVNEGIDSLNNYMFREPQGKINEGLKNKYNAIQEGYKNEVIPYKNKAINEYLRDEINEEELVNALSKRAFYRKRGKYHKALKARKFIKKHPYLAGIGTVSALGAAGDGFYSELFGKK